MPHLGYREVSHADSRPYFVGPIQEEPFFDLNFDVLPFRGKDVTGVVRCEAKVIDAFRSYSICRLEDEKGNVVFTSGWMVDLDPEKDVKFKSDRDSLVKYFIVSRRDFVTSKDLSINVEEVQKNIQRALSYDGEYVGVIGYIYPPYEVYEEIRSHPEIAERLKKKRKEYERAFAEVVGEEF